MEILLLLAVALLAFANGANDNFKGVATLYGSGLTGYRTAMALGTAGALAGSFLSLWLAPGLFARFTGAGVIADSVISGHGFLPAVALGAASTVLAATRFGLPISTTHSLVGALAGAGWAAGGAGIDFARLASLFLAPLLFSPLAAFALAAFLYLATGIARPRPRAKQAHCLCIGQAASRRPVIAHGPAPALVEFARLRIKSGGSDECHAFFPGRYLGIAAPQLPEMLHRVSALAVSVARGVNDAPKIAALLWLTAAGSGGSVVLVGLAMAAGGLISGRRVAETMGRRITPLQPAEGLTANLVTALLVLIASRFSLPVSTTHVAVGSIAALGIITRRGHTGTICRILLAWVTTLPLAAALGALFYRAAI